MALTFLTLQQELADRLNLDYTQSVYATKIKRWLNMSQQLICSRYPFDWQLNREIVQTVVDKTAGTVTFTNGSNSAVGSGTAFAATDKYSFINPSGTTNWFQVTNVSSQTLTLDATYNETTATNSTYTLRKRFYSMTADVERVIDISNSRTPQKLQQLGIFTYDSYQPDPDVYNTGVPIAYYLFGQDPSIAVTAQPIRQIAFFPSPDAVYNLEVKYLKYVSDMTGDTDVSTIPQQYMHVLLQGAEWFAQKYINADEELALNQFELMMSKMIEQESSFDDYMPVLASSDTSSQSQFLPFPASFQQP